MSIVCIYLMPESVILFYFYFFRFIIARSLNVITAKWKWLYLQPRQPVCVCALVYFSQTAPVTFWKLEMETKIKLYKPYNLFGISCLCHCTDLIVQISIYRWFYDWYHRRGASGEVGRCPSIQPALCAGHGREDECIVPSNDMLCPAKLREITIDKFGFSALEVRNDKRRRRIHPWPTWSWQSPAC